VCRSNELRLAALLATGALPATYPGTYVSVGTGASALLCSFLGPA